jgi:ADP-ribose pyrophosphatase
MSASQEPIEVLARGRFVELRRQGRWEYAARVNARGAAMVLALTARGEILLVEQWRVPVQARVIELPAGLVGDGAGGAESAAATALRELLEETGYSAARAVRLTGGPASPGMSSEQLELFGVRQAQRVGPGGGAAHEGEDITVHLVPLAAVHEFLRVQAAAGKRLDPRIYAGLWFAEHPECWPGD